MKLGRCAGWALLLSVAVGCRGRAAADYAATEDGPEAVPAVAPAQTGAPFAHPFEPEAVRVLLHMAALPAPPVDPTNAVSADARAAHLGRFLFFDERLSGTGEISCATCHDPTRSWTDGRTMASGTAPMTRHTPSLWNVAYNRWFFWDGRADSLWAQALAPLEDPAEHAGSRLQYAHLIHDDRDLREAYERIFGPLPKLGDAHRFPAEGRPVPGDVDHPHHRAWMAMTADDRNAIDRVFSNLGKALAAFERRLVSRDSAFDRYVAALRRGDPAPPADFPPAAVRGLALFLGKGECRSCHHGPNFTDKEFHNTLLPTRAGGIAGEGGRLDAAPLVRADPFNGVGAYSDDPSGEAEAKLRFLAVHGDDHGKFKTPSLRNVALTAPYMHQGQFETLEEVLHFYSTLDEAPRYSRHPDPLMQPRNLSEEEIADLVTFLGTLTDDRLPAELTEPPPSPLLGEAAFAVGKEAASQPRAPR
ncbi:MAG: cytochrome c peroxidase [Planctomycetota bacterium]